MIKMFEFIFGVSIGVLIGCYFPRQIENSVGWIRSKIKRIGRNGN